MSWLAVVDAFLEEFEVRLIDLAEVQQILITNSLYGEREHIELDLLLKGGGKVHVADLPLSADVEGIVKQLNLEVRKSKSGKGDLAILKVEETGLKRFSFSELASLKAFARQEQGARA